MILKKIFKVFKAEFLMLSVIFPIAAHAAGDTFITRLEMEHSSELAVMNLVPENGALKIRVINPENNTGFDLSFATGESTCVLNPKRLFPEERERLISTYPAPEIGTNLCWFTFKRTELSWCAFINDHPVLRVPELWSGAVQLQHSPALSPADDEIDDYTQRLGSFTFEDDFLVPAGSAFPPAWEIITGSWKLHSVTGTVTGTGGYTLARQPKPEKSPNFYTLEGGGTNAVVLAGEPFYAHYTMRASIQHNSGTNGIVFLAAENGGWMAFTARTDDKSGRLALDLWQQPRDPMAPPRYIESVQTELPVGQWLLLEIQLLDQYVVCLADHIPVIRHRMELPPGGRFGLYANMTAGEVTRFDDISASNHEDLLITTPFDIDFLTHPSSPSIQALVRDTTCWAYFPPTQTTNVWRYGTAGSAPLRQATLVVSASDEFTAGLTCGAGIDERPYYRFSCAQSLSNRTYTLEYVTTTNTTILDAFTTAVTSNRVHLALDALRPHELKAYADNKLVCFARPGEQPGGIQGVFAVNSDDLFFTAPEVSSTDSTLVERFEKNPLYVNDPYMRHWASPEGQWVTFEDGTTWFKGDITGAVKVRMPVVNNSVLHLCVPEGASNGLCRISVNDDIISLHTEAAGTQAVFTVKAEDIPEVPYEKTKIKLFTVGVDDHLVWLGGDEILIAKTHLPEPLKGRRLRMEGMELTSLKHTFVNRDNVFDTLFTESLYNWSINGGCWEVVNRFFCEPTWSHMNGESSDSLAALWSKYIFAGDFSIEFYAGMRMGWYTRPGDLNLTVMSRSNQTGSGYTAIATGWDPDHSQLYSRLLRDGAQMDITTKYLVPRTREGLARKGHQPLVAKGRDIHGAWYGMQLRRIGNNLQYIYDNEEVFNVIDDNPLQDGSLGIWTYRNSMMVARIKIAAESIQPRPFKFHSIPAGAPTSEPPPVIVDSGVRVNNRVVQPLTPDHWESYDTVSHPVVNFKKTRDGKPEMFVTSLLGAGSFLVKCNLPPAMPDKMLGWRFEMARHPEARVNFEFTTLTENPKKEKQPKQGWTYILCGTTEQRGPRKIAGQSKEIPPSDAEGKNLVWTPVELWIPSEVIRENLAVQIEGFGNLQPSELQEGLGGNPPHAWYAIRGFREIHRGVPELTAPPEQRSAVAELAKVLRSLPPGELQMVQVPATLDPAQPVIEWAVPEMANFGLLAQEDSAIPGSILITPTHPWPSPLLPPKQVKTDAVTAPFETEGNNIRVLIPLGLLKPKHMTLTVELSDGRYFRQVVPMLMNEASNFPPILLSLEMPEGGIKTFEDRPQDPALHKSTAVISFDHSDPVRGGTLKIANDGQAYRLHGFLTKSIDLSATPIVQFKYKGDPMSRTSLSYGSQGFTFSEVYNTHIRYSGQTPAVMDDQWHTWMGVPFDALGNLPLSARTTVKPSYMLFASRSSVDQSGLHSYLQIDDIATGPAVGPQRPFAFKADYIDQDGVAEVQYALLVGDKPYDVREAAELESIKWIACQNSTVVEPETKGLPDGIHHLLVRAKDNRGAWSEPSDLPFMLDRVPPVVSHSINAVDIYNGSALDISISDPVSPPVINDLVFICNGTELDISQDHGFCNIGHGTVHIQLDWIWSLRKNLIDVADGTELPLTITGITDAAGNRCEPYVIKIPIAKSADKRPPTVMPQAQPANTLIFEPSITGTPAPLDAPYAKIESALTPEGRVMQISSVESGKASPYLQQKFTTPWNPETHPFMAISFRSVASPLPTRTFKIFFGEGTRRTKGDREANSLDLLDPESQKYITGQVSSETNVWNDLIINVRDFLRAGADNNKAAPLTSVTVYICAKTAGSVSQLRSLWVMAPWTAKNILTYIAYDLNGVTERNWQGGYVENSFSPANIKPHTPDDNWMRIRFGDAVGNKTDLQMIPLPPALSD
ncbi:MAG: hypothetical protein PHO37_07475 [Kiritimatiellae bacterium]|nr:hypothetical protein [Kiritimatiellia bacterium]